MASLTTTNRPYAVFVPFPAQGHINPMLMLAKLLHTKGFHITFVNTEYNQNRLLNSGGPDSLNGLPDFQLRTIPDGLPFSDDIDVPRDPIALCDSTTKTCLVPFRDLLADINNTDNLPPVSCIVGDGIMSFTLDVAHELGIPEILFWTTSACGFMAYLHFPHLIEKGLMPLKDIRDLTNGYLETQVNWIPGMNDIRHRDLPSFTRTTDPDDVMMNFVLGEVKRVAKASAIVINTFEELEHDVLTTMRAILPPVYCIGSLQLLGNQITNLELNSIASNLWKEEPECLQWLNSKKPNSVIYVNFGSITVITHEQMIEFAWGLPNSKHNFLWIIRPGGIVSGESAILPQEFITETEGRGLIASWCPQGKVLNHPSIAGFLTHSGWNSTLESVGSGVPMICWPYFAEQQMNSRYSCVHWDIGMDLDTNVKRDEVERLVRELIEGEKGKEMKMKAMEWKNKVKEAVAPGGSSSESIDKVINEILIN